MRVSYQNVQTPSKPKPHPKANPLDSPPCFTEAAKMYSNLLGVDAYGLMKGGQGRLSKYRMLDRAVICVAAVLLVLGVRHFTRFPHSQEGRRTGPAEHVPEGPMESNMSILTSCPDDQPLVDVFPNYLPQREFEYIRKELMDNPMSDDSLYSDNFNFTKGWMVRFNADGMEKFRSNPNFKVALPVFDRVRHAQSNAFVVNLLICYEPPPGRNAVEMHLDNSVGMRVAFLEKFLVVAYQVNVLYLQVPEGMEGGALEAWPLEERDTEKGKVVVRPGENVMVGFRGDAYHRVAAFTSQYGKPRVSLVIEQYHLSKKSYRESLDFCIGDECNVMAAQ